MLDEQLTQVVRASCFGLLLLLLWLLFWYVALHLKSLLGSYWKEIILHRDVRFLQKCRFLGKIMI